MGISDKELEFRARARAGACHFEVHFKEISFGPKISFQPIPERLSKLECGKEASDHWDFILLKFR